MGKKVDLNEFTIAMNTYSAIVSSLGRQIQALENAGKTARSAISGEEEAIQSLYRAIEKSQSNVNFQMQQLNGIIRKIEDENEYYVKALGILE